MVKAALDKFGKEPAGYAHIKGEGHFRIMRTDGIVTINNIAWSPFSAIVQNERKRTFSRNTPMVHRMHDAQGYGSLFRKDYTEYIKIATDEEIPFQARARLMGLLNVKYLISLEPGQGPYEPVFKDKIGLFSSAYNGKYYDSFYINESNSYKGRVFIADIYKAAADKIDRLNMLIAKDFDPASHVILEEEPVLMNAGAGTVDVVSEGAAILEYGPEEVIIEAAVNEPKFLVLSDSYYPGWKVEVDGRPDKIYKAYHFLRAVYLDKGRHIVRFTFDPLSYKIGKYISLSTIGLLLLLWLVPKIKRRS